MRFASITPDPIQIRAGPRGDPEETRAGLSSLGLVSISETHIGARDLGSHGERRARRATARDAGRRGLPSR